MCMCMSGVLGITELGLRYSVFKFLHLVQLSIECFFFFLVWRKWAGYNTNCFIKDLSRLAKNFIHVYQVLGDYQVFYSFPSKEI